MLHVIELAGWFIISNQFSNVFTKKKYIFCVNKNMNGNLKYRYMFKMILLANELNFRC